MMQWEVRASWINGLRKQILQIVKSTNTCQFWLMYLPASSNTKIFLLPESSGLKSPYSASVGVYNIRPLWDSVSQHLRTSACALRKSISATHNIYRDMRSIRVNTPVFLFVSAKSEGEEVAVWRTMMMRCCSGTQLFSQPSACWERLQPTVTFYRINMQRRIILHTSAAWMLKTESSSSYVTDWIWTRLQFICCKVHDISIQCSV